MNRAAFCEGFCKKAAEIGLNKNQIFNLYKQAYSNSQVAGTTTLPMEEQILRSLATLPIIAPLGGTASNVAAAKRKYEELGIPEERLSWFTKHPFASSLLSGATGALGGGIAGGVMTDSVPGALVGAGLGGLLGLGTLPAGAAYSDLARAENLAMQEMRKEQLRRMRGL